MSNWLQILSNSQQHSAQALGVINQGMRAIEAQNRWETETKHAMHQDAVRNQQWERQMDFRIQQTNYANQLAAEKFEIEKAFLPIRAAEASMRLANQQNAAFAQHKQRMGQEFNAAISPHIIQAGDTLLGNNNPDYAREFQGIITRHQEAMLRDGSINHDAISYDIGQLNEKYKGTERVEGYNASVPLFLNSWGHSSAAKYYESHDNPKNVASAKAFRTSILYADPDDLVDISTSASKYLPEAEINMAIDQNLVIRSLRKQVEAVNNRAKAAAIDGDSEERDRLLIERGTLESQIDAIAKSVADGVEYKPPVNINDPGETDSNPDIPGKSDNDIIPIENVTPTTFSEVNKIEEARGIEQSIKSVSEFFSADKDKEGLLEGLDISVVREMKDKFLHTSKREHLQKAKQQVARKLYDYSFPELMNLTQTQNFKNVFEEMGRIGIQTPGFKKGKTVTIGGSDTGYEKTKFTEIVKIRNREDFMRAIKGDGLSEAEQTLNFIDLYSSVVAAKLLQTTK